MNQVKIAKSPETYIGYGVAGKLPELVASWQVSRVLVVADPILQSLGVLEKVLAGLDALPLKVDIYTDIIPEPLLETGEKLVAYARKGAYELIIGLGGGSALDLAKLAAVLIVHTGPIEDYLNLTGTRKISQKGIPKILIPTTSGTGAEVTNIAVLALESTKDAVVHDALIADIAIVDPALTLTLPPAVTAATGADALTHAIEAYLSVLASPVSDGLALQAIRLIGGALVASVRNGSDLQARSDMAYGSYLAGLAFFSAGVGAVHALAYPLGGQFHIAHGTSNAILLPYVLQFIRSACLQRLAVISEALGGAKRTGNDRADSLECIHQLQGILQAAGLPLQLESMGITEQDLPLLAADALQQKRLLARCPLVLTYEDILHIYQLAYAGKQV